MHGLCLTLTRLLSYYRQLKRVDIQLRTALSSLEQQEKVLEPFSFRAEEAKESHRKQEEAIESVRQEVDELRKYVAQHVSHVFKIVFLQY